MQSNSLLLLLSLIFLTTATMVPHLPPIDSHIPLTYRVSIDDPPETRWRNIIHDYHEPL